MLGIVSQIIGLTFGYPFAWEGGGREGRGHDIVENRVCSMMQPFETL